MFVAAKWFDPVIGIDIHIIQPPGPVPPVPVPHPFVGIVFDPVGLVVGMAIGAAISGAFGGPFSGPVMINGMPAANTGTEVKGVPVHIPIGGTFVNPPKNEGTIITGSKTVHILGSSAARLTSMVMTCNDPVNMPTSVVMAIPMGPPVFIGGPTSLDIMAAVLAAIRTKWVSDKLHALLKAKPGSWTSRIICFFTGHPVDVVSGRLLTSSIDFTLPGPIPFELERIYYSASTYRGPLGHGWHHSYDQHIWVRGDAIFLRAGDGREIEFDYIEDGESVYEPVERLDLERIKNGFVVRTADRRALHFGPERGRDGQFLLSRIEDLNGNAIGLRYVGGLLIGVFDSSGRRIILENDDAGRLIAVKAPHPEQPGAQVAVARFEYDPMGDLVAVYNASNYAFRYVYRNHLLVKETNRNGLSFYFEFDRYEPDGLCIHTWGDGGIYNHRLTYQKEARLTVVEDSLGAKTTYFYNDFALVTKIVDALGGSTSIAWDDCCRKIAETDPKGSTRQWAFDTRGNCVAQVDSCGVEVVQRFNRLNLMVERVVAGEQRWKWEYDERGNMLWAENPLGHRWTFSYDGRGNVLRQTDPLGGTMRFGWSARNDFVEWITPAGVTTKFSCDELGRTVIAKYGEGQKIRYAYDTDGHLRRILTPEGGQATYEYDAEGNLISEADTRGARTAYRYVGGSQLAERVNAMGFAQQFAYDTEENLIELRNERGEVHRIERDLLGRVRRETAFDGGQWTYQYDCAGNVVALTDPANRIVRFERDAAGRLLKKTAGDGTETSFAYDTLGRVSDAHGPGSDVLFEYDAVGNLIAESQNGQRVQNAYDALGRRVERRSPLGTVARFVYDPDDRVTRVETSSETIAVQYDRFGQLRTLAYPGNVTETRSYDPRGRLISQSVVKGIETIAHRQYAHDSEGNVTEWTDQRWGTRRFSYDLIGQLTQEVRGSGLREAFAFDETGNLRAHGARSLGYAPGDRLLQDGDMTWRFDEAGCAREIAHGEKCTRFDYDAENRLMALKGSDGTRTEYAYDPFGRRISKRRADGDAVYLWDGEALLAEKRGDKFTEYFFQPGGFEPMARLHHGAWETYVTDHLGTPCEISDVRGRLRWSAHFDAFGQLSQARTSEVDNPLRFQGQYYDAESGFHYNRFRYYDPQSARYITQDPIGLYGGTNLYRYVPNPVGFVDPLGLYCKVGKGGLEIGWGKPTPGWKIRLFHLAPSGRFDIFAIKNILRAEIHPISQKLPQWLKVPHIHLDFLPGAWSHVHFPWEFYPGMIRSILNKLIP